MAGSSSRASAAGCGGSDCCWTGFPSSSSSSATAYSAAMPPTRSGARFLRGRGVLDRRSGSTPTSSVGVDPTVQLQRWLYHPGLHFWDYLVWACYMSHFFASFIIAGVLWKTNYPKFRRFRAPLRGPDVHRLHHLRALSGHAPLDGQPVRAHPPHDADHRPGVEAPAPRPGPVALRRRQQVRQQRGGDALAPRRLPDAHLPLLLEGLQPAQARPPGRLSDLHGLLAGLHGRALRDRHLRGMDLRRRHLLLRIQTARPLGGQADAQAVAGRGATRTRSRRSTPSSRTRRSSLRAETPRSSSAAFERAAIRPR